MRTRSQDTQRLVIESTALGLGYISVLIWVGSALVGSFGWDDAYPYWPNIPHLRTDTLGAVAFLVAIVTLSVSKYLELRRNGELGRHGDVPTEPVPRSAGAHAVQAVAETAAVLSTALVIYLSCNAFMHPWTLRVHLTHLLPWPSEGTVRVIALGICLVAVATRRYLRATATRPGQAQTVQEKASVSTQGLARTGSLPQA